MTQLEQSFLELIEGNQKVFFDDVIVKKMFVVLYISKDFVALDEVASRASLSLASVSNKAKELASMGLIERVRRPGSKKIFLKVKTNFFAILSGKMAKKCEVMEKSQKELKSFIDSQKDKSLSSEEKSQLKNLKEFHNEMKRMSVFHKDLTRFIENYTWK